MPSTAVVYGTRPADPGTPVVGTISTIRPPRSYIEFQALLKHRDDAPHRVLRELSPLEAVDLGDGGQNGSAARHDDHAVDAVG
jgi:hypothetical protein